MHKPPSALRKRGQKGLDGGIIAKSRAAMSEPVNVTGAKDKTASKLKGISSQFVLQVPGGFSAGTRIGIVAAQQMKQVCALKFHGGVGFALFVNKQGEGNARFLAKSPRINAIPKPNRG